MQEWLIARAARLATAAGAQLVVEPSSAGHPPAPLNSLWLGGCPAPIYDPTDTHLKTIANALQTRAQAAGITLLALHREANTLHVLLDDGDADEPLTPNALQSTIRQLAWQLLGQVWDAILHTPPHPATPAHAA
ncbi:MAG TPA: hypothetical protein VK191_01745 [Symbiobacteriaceae bacterium]|nr:hypothetical protein [Symbiobacteriaceae bacterium]